MGPWVKEGNGAFAATRWDLGEAERVLLHASMSHQLPNRVEWATMEQHAVPVVGGPTKEEVGATPENGKVEADRKQWERQLNL